MGRHREDMEVCHGGTRDNGDDLGGQSNSVEGIVKSHEDGQTLEERPRALLGSPSLERGRSPLAQTLRGLHYRSLG